MENVSLIPSIIKELAGIIAAIGVIVLGYWHFRTMTIATKAAAAVKEELKSAVQTIETTSVTVQESAVKLATVQKQTDGHLTEMREILREKSDELKAESKALLAATEKIAKLSSALDAAENGPKT